MERARALGPQNHRLRLPVQEHSHYAPSRVANAYHIQKVESDSSSAS